MGRRFSCDLKNDISPMNILVYMEAAIRHIIHHISLKWKIRISYIVLIFLYFCLILGRIMNLLE